MVVNRVKCLLVAAFSAFLLGFSMTASAKEEPKQKFDANEVIFGHVMDAHSFHFFSYEGGDGKQHHAGIPLPVILYVPGKGIEVFSSSKFHHGEEAYNGYQLVTPHYKEHLKENGVPESELKTMNDESIIAVDEAGHP